MPTKRGKKVSRKKKNSELERLEETLKYDIKKTEQWIIEQRKFLIKLAWMLGLMILLLIISHFFLRIQGAGI